MGELLDKRLLKSETILFLFVFVMVFVSRLPFLDAGYGLDSDSYRSIFAARKIYETGSYHVSRFPGYPLYELSLSLVWFFGPIATNGLSALCSGIAAAFFAAVLCRLGGSKFFAAVGAIAFAFVPAVYRASTETMDYMMAMAFIMPSLYYILQRRAAIAGVLLGLAIGSRITSGFFVVPFALILLSTVEAGEKKKLFIYFLLPLLIIPVLLYGLVWFKYGEGFFTYFGGRTINLRVIKRATTSFLGNIGVISVGCALGIALLENYKAARRHPGVKDDGSKRLMVAASGLAVIMCYALYFFLPHESAYLIPAAPFIILLFVLCGHRVAYYVACGGLIFTSFVGIGGAGEIFTYYGDRTASMAALEAVNKDLDNKNVKMEKFALGTGECMPYFQVERYDKPEGTAKYVYLTNEADIVELKAEGYEIMYLPCTTTSHFGVIIGTKNIY